eukprot:3494192-Rhodomonas_salina.1
MACRPADAGQGGKLEPGAVYGGRAAVGVGDGGRAQRETRASPGTPPYAMSGTRTQYLLYCPHIRRMRCPVGVGDGARAQRAPRASPGTPPYAMS